MGLLAGSYIWVVMISVGYGLQKVIFNCLMVCEYGDIIPFIEPLQ